jgi:hypothetical protein
MDPVDCARARYRCTLTSRYLFSFCTRSGPTSHIPGRPPFVGRKSWPHSSRITSWTSTSAKEVSLLSALCSLLFSAFRSPLSALCSPLPSLCSLLSALCALCSLHSAFRFAHALSRSAGPEGESLLHWMVGSHEAIAEKGIRALLVRNISSYR